MEISAKMVSELREKTGTGMMKCKEALIATKGNFNEAVDYLRKKGLASADNKAGRAPSQGLITAKVSEDRRVAALIETNCETDFVARNIEFVTFTNKIIDALMANPDLDSAASLSTSVLPGGAIVEDARKGLVSKTGENISIGRAKRLAVKPGAQGLFDTYVHGDGKIGVVVQLGCSSAQIASRPEVVALAHDVALQVAAMNPLFPTRNEVPENVIAKEKEIILAQLQNDPKNAKKPENIINKIVEGRLDKFFKERVLIEQAYVKDDTKSIQDLLTDAGKQLSGTVTISSFCRWAVGERLAGVPAAAAEGACCAGCCC